MKIDNDLILIADDSTDTADAIRKELEKIDYDVHVTRFVETAVEWLAASPDQRSDHRLYSAAIIDLDFSKTMAGPTNRTAGMTILDAALRVPYCQPLILTAYPNLLSSIRSVEVGAFRYVVKSTGGPGGNFLDRIVDEVRLALDVRRIWIALGEDLDLLESCCSQFMKSPPSVEKLAEFGETVKDARLHFNRLLTSRTKHPDLGPMALQY